MEGNQTGEITERWLKVDAGFFKSRHIIGYVSDLAKTYAERPPIANKTSYFSVSINTTSDEQFENVMDYIIMVLKIPRGSIDVRKVKIPIIEENKTPKSAITYTDKDGNHKTLVEV